MTYDDIAARGMVIFGCGKMGSAMLAGWLARGIPPACVTVIDPHPSDWLKAAGVNLNTPLPANAAVAIIAVKPQMMGEALPNVVAHIGPETLVISVAAGTPIARFEAEFGASTKIIRAMPNTPAAIGCAITALIGNGQCSQADLELGETLLSAVGQVVRLETEDQIDAVTGVSGSGPAYVLYMIDSLAAAARAEGLPDEMAMELAKATVAGAGALAREASESPEQLRINVTSPNGTTQAGLEVLMDEASGLAPLIRETVKTAAARSRALKG